MPFPRVQTLSWNFNLRLFGRTSLCPFAPHHILSSTTMAQLPSDNDMSHHSSALSPHDPLHVVHHRVFIYERRTGDGWPDLQSNYPYSYHLIREWDCNCAAHVSKKRRLHLVEVKSPLQHPDYRLYRCLGGLEPADPMEPPHARAYRETYGTDGMAMLYAQAQGGINVLPEDQ
jgi:hypothetical protein